MSLVENNSYIVECFVNLITREIQETNLFVSAAFEI